MVEDLLNEIKKLEGRVKDLETSTQRIARIEKENRKLTERVDMLECVLREMNRTREQTNTAPQQNYQRPLQTGPQQAANLPPYTIRYVKCRHLPQAKCMYCPEYNMPQNNMDMQNMQNMLQKRCWVLVVVVRLCSLVLVILRVYSLL